MADHSDMMISTKAEFDSLVAATVGGKPLVIDFTATWCPPCQSIGPVYVGHVAGYPELVLKKCDVDANRETSEFAKVRCMPTFKVYKNGDCAETMEGANPAGLIELLNRAKA